MRYVLALEAVPEDPGSRGQPPRDGSPSVPWRLCDDPGRLARPTRARLGDDQTDGRPVCRPAPAIIELSRAGRPR
jgi:hypothetical protein